MYLLNYFHYYLIFYFSLLLFFKMYLFIFIICCFLSPWMYFNKSYIYIYIYIYIYYKKCWIIYRISRIRCSSNSFISSYFLAQHPYVFHQEFNSEHRWYVLLFACKYVCTSLILACERDFYFGGEIWHHKAVPHSCSVVICLKKGLCFEHLNCSGTLCF